MLMLVQSGSKSEVATYNVHVDDHAQPLDTTGMDIYVDILVTDVVPAKSSLRLTSHILRLNSTGDIDLMAGTFEPHHLSAKSLYLDQDVTVCMDGDTSTYPFDTWTAQAPFGIIEGNASFACVATSSLSSFHLSMSFTTIQPNLLMLHVTIQRSAFIKSFSVLNVVLMWALTLAMTSATVHTIISKREVAPPLLAVYIALLFALPSMRNAQPAIPPIGIVLDTIGLFWNMCIIALCAIILIITWIRQFNTIHAI
jgi:hypothetical protein